MTNSNDIARESARDRNGQFGEQPKSEPEVALPQEANPGRTLTHAQEMQLGMRGPTNANTFQDRFDAELDDRPTRPYLALTVSDDDEFFDAPEGAVLEVVRPDGVTERYERAGHHIGDGWTWHKLGAVHGSAVGSIETGELWGSLFHDTEMDSAQVIMPPGRYFENWQSTSEKPVSSAEAQERLRGSQWEMTSRYLSGDELEAGTRPSDRGRLPAELSDDGQSVTFGEAGTFPLRDGMVFDRDGDLIIRKDDDGYGFEYAFRPVV